MQHLFVSYELALRVRNLGFNEPCFKETYDNDQDDCEIYPDGIKNSEILEEDWLTVPLYQQVIDWLRFKHSLYLEFHLFADGYINYYSACIQDYRESYADDIDVLNPTTGESRFGLQSKPCNDKEEKIKCQREDYYYMVNLTIEKALELVEEKNGIHKDT